MIRKRMVFLAMLLAAGASLHLEAQRVIALPGAGAANSEVKFYTPSPLIYALSTLTASGSPAGAFRALSNPAGNRYYILSSSGGAGALSVVDSTGAAVQAAIALPQPAAEPGSSMRLTPDGRRLVVLAGKLWVFDVTGSTAAALFPGIDVGTSPSDFAISIDSKRAFVISASDSRLRAVDLASGTALATSLSVTSPTGVAAAPNGLIYVSASAQLLEIDGGSGTGAAMVQLRSKALDVNALPTRAAFTPDGRYAIMGSTSLSGPALIVYDTVNAGTPASTTWPGHPLYDRILVPDNNRFFALSSSAQAILTATVGLAILDSSFGGGGFTGVTSAITSDEIPAGNLYVAASGNLTRVDLTSNLAAEQVSSPRALSWAAPQYVTTATQVQKIQVSQTAVAGSATLPLVIRALDSNGKPQANAAVTWSATGLSGGTQMTATNSEGLAQATFITPTTAGTFTVSATVGGTVASFTITTGSGGTGGGTGGGTAGAGIQIISGQGLVVPANSLASTPLIVQVNDASGNPIPSAQVTWSMTSSPDGTANLFQGTSTCTLTGTQLICPADANGRSTLNFVGGTVLASRPYAQFTITASVTINSIAYTATLYDTVVPLVAGLPVAPLVQVLAPANLGDTVQGTAGGTASAAVKVNVFSIATPSGPIPRVGLSVSTPPGGPSATCSAADGVALTDGTGVATCDLVFGSLTGQAQLTINVGGFASLTPYHINVGAGAPAQITIVSGNNQSGNPGETLPLALVATIADAGGNLLPFTAATWTITSGSATLVNTSSTSDVNGRVSTGLKLGTTPGQVQVTITAGNGSATFTATVKTSITSLTKSGGDNQSAVTNTQFASPLTVTAVSPQGALPNLPVSFTASGPVSLVDASGNAASSANTNASGVATIYVKAGGTAGSATVTATAGGQTVTFTLTVKLPAPPLTVASFLNGASFQQGVPFGGVVTIQGDNFTGLSLAAGTCVTGPGTIDTSLPTRVAGIEVQFGSLLAPIYAVCKTSDGKDQINVQAPFELAPATITAVVRTGIGSNPAEVAVNGIQVVAAQPGIFQYSGSDGRLYGVILRPDGTVVGPSNPARRGEILRMYSTGLGPVSPWVPTNRPGVPNETTYFTPVVTVGGSGMSGVTAEYAENMIGVFVVTFSIPSGGPSGTDVQVKLDVTSPDGQTVYQGGTARIVIQ